MKRSGFAAIAVLTALATGATAEETADPRLGEQVDGICFGRNINNFRAIDGVDNAILLEKGVNNWYKATLIGACNFSQLKWAQSVAIEQRPTGGCVTRGDYLIFSNSAFGDFSFPNSTRCAISEIHEWNPEAAAVKAEDDAATPD